MYVCVCADKTGARTFSKLRRQRCDVRCAFPLARVLWPPTPTLEIYINRKIMPQRKWLCLLHVRTLHKHILAEHHTFSLPAEKVLFFLSAERKIYQFASFVFVCCGACQLQNVWLEFISMKVCNLFAPDMGKIL
jgi:hypothetical protein